MNPVTSKIRNREKEAKALKEKRLVYANKKIDEILNMNELSAGVVIDKNMLMQIIPLVFEKGKLTIKYTLWEK